MIGKASELIIEQQNAGCHAEAIVSILEMKSLQVVVSLSKLES